MTELPDPLALIRRQIKDVPDAIRWACILEATAPKAGNVHPTQSFGNLRFADFITAANITADSFGTDQLSIAAAMLNAVKHSREATGTNVNLGIVLLLGPLVAATSTEIKPIADVLDAFTLNDGQLIFEAIRVAGAGGLGSVDSMDVANAKLEPIDIVAAMKAAASRDRIALQYAEGFADLIKNIVPVVSASIKQHDDILGGIADAHLTLMANDPDSLIARKCGDQVAMEVQTRAKAVDRSDADSVAEFDRFLRSRGNLLNPGTTADLIAAALFILLRTS